MSDKFNKAKRELQGYKEILSTVWDEDLTDEEELIYLKFYRAGIKIAETNNLKHETVEQWENRTGKIYPNLRYVVVWSDSHKDYKLYFCMAVSSSFKKSKMYVVNIPDRPNHHGKPNE